MLVADPGEFLEPRVDATEHLVGRAVELGLTMDEAVDHALEQLVEHLRPAVGRCAADVISQRKEADLELVWLDHLHVVVVHHDPHADERRAAPDQVPQALVLACRQAGHRRDVITGGLSLSRDTPAADRG
jgi:hypothetical protein